MDGTPYLRLYWMTDQHDSHASADANNIGGRGQLLIIVLKGMLEGKPAFVCLNIGCCFIYI